MRWGGLGEGWICPRLPTEWVNRLGLALGQLGTLMGTSSGVRRACVGGIGLLNWDWTMIAVFLGH